MDRRSDPSTPCAGARPAHVAADLAEMLVLAAALALAAAAVTEIARPAVPALSALAAGISSGFCFLIAEQAYMRWRLVGDAIAAHLCIAFLVYGACVVPTALARGDGPGGALVQTFGSLAASASLLGAARCPVVDSGFHFLRRLTGLAVAAVAAALLPGLSPAVARAIAEARLGGEPALELVGALVLTVTAGLVSAAAIRRDRRILLRCGVATADLVVVPAIATSGPTTYGATLTAGVVQLAAVALVVPVTVLDTRMALSSVGRANQNLRRRWRDALARVDDLGRAERERAHDIRSALLAIEGAAVVLRRNAEGIGQDDGADLAAAVQTEIVRLQQLLGGIPVAPPEGYRLCDALQALVVTRRAAGQEIEFTVPACARAVGHPQMVVEAVGNLLANAAEHAPGAHVTIGLGNGPVRPGFVRLVVSDDGPGIAPRNGKRVEPPVPGDAAAPPPPTALHVPSGDGHLGVGLPVAARLVEQEGGRLTIVPSPAGGRGTVIAIELPRPATPEEATWSSTMTAS